MRYQPIENYGIVGDLHTVALVGVNGSIDFMCFPFIDSPTIFARLLDAERGGFFQLAPEIPDARKRQIYLSDTNILLSRFLAEGGVAEVSDFMPVDHVAHEHILVRRAKTVRGEIPYRMVCKPAFDYARLGHRVEVNHGEVLFIPDERSHPTLRLRTNLPITVVDGAATAEFTLTSGQSASFVLEEALPNVASPSAEDGFVARSFRNTVNYWHQWIGRSRYQGRWREQVNRSALTLKLLTSWDHGAIVAAPTFGLPEEIGGERNWDYRYTWIRDASFTLYALLRLGFTEEAGAFMKWIEARCGDIGPESALQIMYAVDGRAELDEQRLDHLEGYRGSRPVRIGNGAYNQLQLDIYGELMDSVYLYDKYGAPITSSIWNDLAAMLNWLSKSWNQADEGIWEVRGGRKHFLHSRLMSWVALDRGVRLAVKRSLPAPLDAWREARDAIYHQIHTEFWNEKLGAFTQSLGSKSLDASSLLMPLVRFISPVDPRWLSHLDAIEKNLVYDSLVYRYNTLDAAADGLHGDEGTFSMCSFWYVECLSRAGQIQKARFYFEKMLGYANHLGLFAEELSPRGEHLGNFPQAFTHLALISAAFDIDRRLNDAGWRG